MGLKSSLVLFANPHVLAQSWATLRQEHLFKICTKLLSECQTMLPQGCVSPGELLFSNLPEGPYDLAAALPNLGRLPMPFSLVGKKNPHAVSQ